MPSALSKYLVLCYCASSDREVGKYSQLSPAAVLVPHPHPPPPSPYSPSSSVADASVPDSATNSQLHTQQMVAQASVGFYCPFCFFLLGTFICSESFQLAVALIRGPLFHSGCKSAQSLVNAAQVSERGSKVAETSTIGQRGSRPTNEDVFEKKFL